MVNDNYRLCPEVTLKKKGGGGGVELSNQMAENGTKSWQVPKFYEL